MREGERRDLSRLDSFVSGVPRKSGVFALVIKVEAVKFALGMADNASPSARYATADCVIRGSLAAASLCMLRARPGKWVALVRIFLYAEYFGSGIFESKASPSKPCEYWSSSQLEVT